MMAFEEVEEQNVGGLVSNGRGEALTRDDVPPSRLILQVSVRFHLSLNLGGQVLVELALRRGLLDEPDSLVDHIPGHVCESNAVRGKRVSLHLFFGR